MLPTLHQSDQPPQAASSRYLSAPAPPRGMLIQRREMLSLPVAALASAQAPPIAPSTRVEAAQAAGAAEQPLVRVGGGYMHVKQFVDEFTQQEVERVERHDALARFQNTVNV